MGREKYIRATALFSQGTELELEEDLVIWLQVLNPFELEDAKGAASAARSRLVLALQEHGSDELARYEAMLSEMSEDELVELLIQAKHGETLLEVTDAIENDPEWAERMNLIEREEEIRALPDTAEERKLLEGYEVEYITEVQQRMDYELKMLKAHYDGLTPEQRRTEFRRFWIDRRGGERAMEEFRLKEHFYAARVCDAVKRPDGTFDHKPCDHGIRVWETEGEVRHLPDELRNAIDAKLRELTMSPKGRSGSDNPRDSSESSPTPSEPAASTPSTRTAT